MKKDQRKIYLELTKEAGTCLCLACKYAGYEGCGDSICDGGEGHYECNHPIEILSFLNTWEEELEPGIDCYGFKARIDIETLTEFTSTILTNGIKEWMVDISKGYFEIGAVKHTLFGQNEYTKYVCNLRTVTNG